MSHKFKCGIAFMIAGLSISGCAGYDRVLFVTKTNVGLDIDNKPPTAEITIARRELAITPTFQNAHGADNTLPLLASFALTGGFLNPEIISRFAGGDAAIILAQGSNQQKEPYSLCLTSEPHMKPLWKKIWHFLSRQNTEDTRAFYFATDTSFGLKVGWDGSTGPYPDTLKLGYNRKELAFPPIFTTEGCPDSPGEGKWKVTVPSFVASLDNSSTIKEVSKSGTTHIQFFATGKAATEFVKRADVNAAMNQTMYPHDGLSIDPVASVVAVSGTKDLKVTGATGLVKFTLMNDTTSSATVKAEVDASTGHYKAGPNAGISIVGVADAAGRTAVTTVTVNPALAIAPVSQNVAHGTTFQFNATGGVEPLKFSVSDNRSVGATIDEKTGLYRAGSTAPTKDKVKVTDSSSPPVSIEATVSVQ